MLAQAIRKKSDKMLWIIQLDENNRLIGCLEEALFMGIECWAIVDALGDFYNLWIIEYALCDDVCRVVTDECVIEDAGVVDAGFIDL